MTTRTNYSSKKQKIQTNAYTDFDQADSYDPMNEESIQIEEWVKFISYYRYYIDEFAVNILGMKLYPFQRLILRYMARYKESMFIASRGLGKSYLAACFFICVAILYPGISLGIASGKGRQARNVIIQKIKGELYKNENVAREIVDIKTGTDDCCVIFKNGSQIRAIVLGQDGENARSFRFHQLLIDESRLVKDSIISEILIPMTKTKRPAMINLSMKYGNKVPVEKGKIIYISSAYLKTCDLYKRFLSHFEHMKNGDEDFFVCTLPYQVGVNAGIFYEDDILSEREKPDMTKDKFQYEYEAIFVGSSSDSYYPYDLTEKCRKLPKSEIKQNNKSEIIYIISHDVATSNAKDSDNACTTVIKLKEKPNGMYSKEVVYIKTHNGTTLIQQRDFLRELLIKFPNTQKLVIDARGNGEALPTLFDETWEYTDENGKVTEYPPLVPDDDIERMNLTGAVPLIRAITATNQTNNTIYTYMKSCFENESLKLLVSSAEVDMDYKDGSISFEEYSCFVNTDLLIQELSNITQSTSGHNNVIYGRIMEATKRDRVTSLGYGLLVVSEMEKENKLNANNLNVDIHRYVLID